MAKKPKTVSFYQVRLLAEARAYPPKVEWAEAVARVAALPMAERTHDRVVYDVPPTSGDAPIVAVHEVLDPAFMSRIGSESITDLMGEAEAADAGRFANSTAIAFLPVGNAVAVIKGGTSSPRPPAVIKQFLERHLPQGENVHWDAQPLLDRAKIKQFREEAKGAVGFSSRIRTVRDLFSPDESDGIAKYADQLAQRTHGDVIIDISVRLAPESRTGRARRALRDMVLNDLPRVVNDPSTRAKVFAVLDGDVEEELSLVAHRLAAKVEIDQSTTESRLFSALLAHLEDVSATMEDRVREIVEE